jgi:predicted component of type VI protein secretion system
MSRVGVLRLCASLCAVTMVSGCALSPLAKRATAFSTAASTTTLEVKNAYEVVEQSYYDVEVATLVKNFDQDGFDPAKFQPFLSTDDMKARTQLLEGLQQYATLLAAVSGNEPVTALDQQAEAVGKKMQALSTDSGLKSVAKNASMDGGIAAAAVDALGRVLVERKTARELPSILDNMQKPMDQICQLLEDDIGDPEKGGLRNQLKVDYDRLIADQRAFVYANEKAMGPEEKQAAIAKLPELAAEEKKDDAALAQTQDALKKLATTHDALVDTKKSKDAPAFETLVSQLVEEGQQLGAVYSAATAKEK